MTRDFRVVRQGVFNETNLKRLASFMIVLVCTGNTCRSPMAEALLKKRIADRLGCKIEELDDRGVVVMSAGIQRAARWTCGCRSDSNDAGAQARSDAA